LLQRADINIGSHVTSMFRVRAKSADKSGGEKTKDLRQLTYFGRYKSRKCHRKTSCLTVVAMENFPNSRTRYKGVMVFYHGLQDILSGGHEKFTSNIRGSSKKM
jgi:hypothetical protein